MVLQREKINRNSLNFKNKIGIIVDDVCSLSEDFLKKHNVEVVKTRLFLRGVENLDGVNIYQIMRKDKIIPKTSAPSPGQFLKAYEKSLEKNNKILVITLSSKLSGTYNSALQAKKLLPNPSLIEIVDSFSAVAAEGLLVYKTIDLCKVYNDLEKIKGYLEKIKEEIKLFAFLETTFWVERIGRITRKRAFGFKALKALGVMPIIGIKKGEVGIVGFNFWTTKHYKAIFHQLKKEAKRAKKNNKRLVVGINYTDNKDLAFWLKEKIEKKLNGKVAFVSLVPLIVGANSGPGTLIAASYID